MNPLLFLFALYFVGVFCQVSWIRTLALVLLLITSYILYIDAQARYHQRCLRYHEEE